MGKKKKSYDDQIMYDAFDWANKQHANYTQTRKSLEEANELLAKAKSKDEYSTIILGLSAVLAAFMCYEAWNIIQILKMVG